MNDEFKPLTKNEDLKYQLQTLASYEKDMLEDPEIEVYYEDKNGMEGAVSVELMGLGDRALKRIEALELALDRLGSCEAFTLSHVPNNETTARIDYARASLTGNDTND